MTVRATVSILGIRHHGPGSAQSVADALAEISPDFVLVEGPGELTKILPLLVDPETVPPIAGLVYDAAEPSRASFYPLASFSPEWVATRWALNHDVTVEWADLPGGNQLALRAAVTSADTAPEPAVHRDEQVTDPIAALAAAAGYDEPERWWEDAVEHAGAAGVLDRFDAVREAIAELRTDEPAPTPLVGDDKVLDAVAASNPLGSAMTGAREAAMRKALRAAIKAGHQRIAVVCGAWHAPALDPTRMPSAAADNRLLRGLPKTKVAVAWVPWTATRLSQWSGYGAGVASPGWYRHLFEARRAGHDTREAAASWLVLVARELRAQGRPASPAAVVDAVRLASTLAGLRGRPHPGLSELDDAALAVLADGDRMPLTLVNDSLVVGADIGAVPESAPLVPLAADLQRQQKGCRLRPTAQAKSLMLDLRTDSGRAKSVLLHRLRALDITWGLPGETGSTTGTFKEAWELEWDPAMAVDVVEASVYGTTVASAAAAKVAADADAATTLGALSELIDLCLLADLPIDRVVAALADRAAAHTDVPELLAAVEPLARVCRYGNVRQVATDDVRAVLDQTAVRACLGLPSASTSLSDDAAVGLRTAVESAHRGLMLLDDMRLADYWYGALRRVADHDRVPGTLVGRATRMLLDAGRLHRDEVERRMGLALSTVGDPVDAAGWLDGFLAGDALVLMHDAALLAVVDEWMSGVATEVFDDLLPLLRRTFSGFSKAERRIIGQSLTRAAHTDVGAASDLGQAAPAMAAVARLIGWETM
ncbi:DUF5682 family protein [Gordonia phthalatica]|uniref:Uncharacterized protein n=1 Tax=Gordonia phthalatica TaxID=1136941 RepID=A0A0N9NHY8_9ACTN|nr:DUF5682 family protein [Gordonia phthalatica]ALG85097.1 hypothetical protein ACH46_12170 [Gordonia phthalatica]